MPEAFSAEGLDVEKLTKQFSSSLGDMKGDMDTSTESTKEFARNVINAANSMNLLTETMSKSRGVYNDFGNSLERSAVIMQSFGRVITDVSGNLRGATSSMEGFISALSTLGSKTFPEITKNLVMTIAGYDRHAVQLKNTKAAIEEEIKDRQDVVNATKMRIAEDVEKSKTAGFFTKGGRSPQAIKEDVDYVNNQEKILQKLRMAHLETSEAMGVATASSKGLSVALTTMLGPISIIVGAIVAVTMAYDNSIKAKREVLYTLSRMGVAYSTNKKEMDAFEASFVNISSKWGMMREEMAKALAPLTGLGVGVGKGGAEESFKSGVLGKTMTAIEDWTGAMMRSGVDAGVTSRAFGTLGTVTNLTGEALGDTFGKLAALGNKSALGLQGFLTQTISLMEMTRKYGGEVEGAQILTSAFSSELKKGTIGMESLARLAAPAMWSSEQKGAMVSLMQQFAPKEAGQLGMNTKDMFTNMANLEKAAKDIAQGGNPEVLALGIQKTLSRMTGAGIGTDQQAFMMQAFLKDTIGVQVTTLEVSKAMLNPEKWKEMLKPPKVESPEEIKAKAELMFNKTSTIAEASTAILEHLRNGVLNVATKTAEVRDSSVGQKYIDYQFNQPNIMKELFNMIFHKKGKATGGYISEEGEYMLHAGEQVRRPGEGTGGDVNVSLGGMSVSIGDRGDMGSQINEAFDEIKRETIREIEKQWEQSLHAH